MIKISYVMNVLNGEPFIKYQLDSIYSHAYEIIIVEGAYRKFAHSATVEGRSTDNTVEIISSYPDPENKIVLVQNPGFYDDRLDMCNEFLQRVTGDVIWQVDADEFYLDSTHTYVYDLFSTDPELDRVCFNFYDFFGSLDYFIKGYEHIGLDNIRRVHRYKKGEKWLDQRPPTLSSNNQEKVIRKEITGSQMQIKGHMMFHPTLLFDSQVMDKYQYYSSISSSINKPNKWIVNVWQKYNNKFNVSGIKNYITYLEHFSGETYPKPLSDMYSKVKQGEYAGFNARDMADVDSFMSSSASESYQKIAQNLFQSLYLDSSALRCIKILVVVFNAIRQLDRYTLIHFLRVTIVHLIKQINTPYVKIIYTLIFLTVVGFIMSVWTQSASENTLLRMNKNDSLSGYIASSGKGDSYLFSSLVREHFFDFKVKKANVLFSYNNKLERQPYFRKIFSDGVAEIILYPHKLKQNVHYRYILTDQEYKNLLKEEWIEKKGRGATFFLPKLEFCNRYKIMIYQDANVFLFPLCSKSNLI